MTGPQLGKETLLDAAAELFDAAGVDAVSLNQIVRASGHRNRSAVSYHYGTRDDVVRAVVERSMAGPDARRHELLDQLLARESEPSLGAVLEVVVGPLSESLATMEGRRHLRLLGQLVGHPRLLATTRDALRGNESLIRCTALVVGHLAGLPIDLRDERVALLVAFVMRSYADQARLLESDAPPRPPLATALYTANLVELMVAMLTAPLPHPG